MSWIPDASYFDDGGDGAADDGAAAAGGAAGASLGADAALNAPLRGDADQVTDQAAQFNYKDHTVFLVDCSPGMFAVNPESGLTLFQESMRCCKVFIVDKIIRSDTDESTVVFFNTVKKQNTTDFDNVWVIGDLDVPDAKRIKDVENYGHALGAAADAFPHGTLDAHMPLHKALWVCQNLFATKPKQSHKRIFLFTCNDDPNAADKSLRTQALQKATDIADLGIQLELFPLVVNGGAFDVNRFYINVLSIDEDENTGNVVVDVAEKMKDLMDSVRRKAFKKRTLSRFPFVLGDGLEVGMKMYSLCQEAVKKYASLVDQADHTPVKTRTRYLCDTTGATLLPMQMKSSFEYGGTKVVFTKEETREIKTLGKPGLYLLGFKPRRAVPMWMNVKHSSFLYPDEDAIAGSTVAFHALHRAMLESDRVCIARLTARAGYAPRFVALVPQPERFDDTGHQVVPPGWHVVWLPFTDDIRDVSSLVPPRKETTASREQVGAVKALVKKFGISFDPYAGEFENPALAKHYSSLQALALEQATVEDTPDYLQPDTDGMAKHEEVAVKARVAVYGEGFRRSAEPPAAIKGAGTKRKAPPAAAVDPATANWKLLAASGGAALKKLKVADLRAYITWKGITLPGRPKKADLIARIVQEEA